MKTYILFIFILSISLKCFPQWTQCNGPFGGSINCLSENKKSNTLFAGTYSSGIFRFKNSVNHWENLLSQLPRNDIDEIGIMDSIIFVAAHDLYSSRRGLFKSIDNGDSWDTLYVDSTVTANGVNNIFCNDSLLIISAYSKIYVSNDAGNSFNEIGHNLSDTATDIYDLMIEAGRIFAVYHSMSYNATISYSDNLGLSWQKPISPNGWSYQCKRLRAYSNKLEIPRKLYPFFRANVVH